MAEEVKQLDADLYSERPDIKEQIKDWLKEAGINIGLVPLDARIEFFGDHRAEIEIYDAQTRELRWHAFGFKNPPDPQWFV